MGAPLGKVRAILSAARAHNGEARPLNANQKIIDAFAPEFARLAMVTLMLPWGDDAGA